MKYLFILLLSLSFSYANKFYYEFDKKVEVQTNTATKSLNETYSDVQEYTTSEGKTVKFKNEILVQCNENSYCEDDFEDLNLTTYKKIGEATYLITLDNTQDIFSFCQELYEKDDIKSAHPNYIRKLIRK
jgi:transcriptional/translational regulatory protein YebC/TACO1